MGKPCLEGELGQKKKSIRHKEKGLKVEYLKGTIT